MNDIHSSKPDHPGLFQTASQQAGYFTTHQATDHGLSSALLTYHAKKGRFIRVSRGVYRIRDYPSSEREHLIASWLGLGQDAVVSHESALDVLGLSDVIPNQIHLTVPRARRRLARPAGAVIHTTKRPLTGGELVSRDGLRLTAPARTVVDVAESGAAPEQVIAAIREAIKRGLATPTLLREAAADRGSRVTRLVDRALEGGDT